MAKYDYVKEDFIFDCEYKDYNLVHYTSFEGLKGIIENKEIWFTKAEFFNDTTEGMYFESLYKVIINEYKEMQLLSNELLDLLKTDIVFRDCLLHWQISGVNKQFDALPCDVFICSFSKKEDCLPMWNYYGKAAKMKGVSIKLDRRNLWKDEKDSFNNIRTFEVIYDEKKQRSILKTALDNLLKNKKAKDKMEFKTAYYYFIEQMRKMKYACKNPCFAYENEIRLIVYISKSENKYIEYRINKQGILIPFIKIKIEIDNPIISVAPLANYELIKKSLEGFLLKNDVKQFSIEQSKCPVRW